MKEKIKEALKKFGLDTGLHEKIKAEKEEDINRAILDYMIESESDRRSTKAVKTREDALKAEHEIEITKLKESLAPVATKTGDGGDDKSKEGEPDMAQIIKQAVEAATKPLADKIAVIETNDTETVRITLVAKALKDAELPESMAKYISAQDSDGIDASIKTLKEDFGAQLQASIDANLGEIGNPVTGGGASITVSENTALDFAKSLNENDSAGGLVSKHLETQKE